MPNIKHGDDLLGQIATGLKALERVKVGDVKVTFKDGDSEYTFGLVEAIDAIASDIYWNEEGNWAEATVAVVDVY